MFKKLMRLFNNEKDAIILKNTLSAFLIKGAALLVSLISLPIYLRYFENEEVLGVWFTILSVLIWILSFDFGIGNGLRNRLVSDIIQNDSDQIKQSISSSYFIMALISVITLIVGAFLIPLVNWNVFFNVPTILISPDTMSFVLFIVFLTILLQFLLRIINFILYSLQKSALNNFIALITSVSQVVLVVLLPSADAESNLRMLSVIYLFTVNVPLVVASFYVFSTELKGLYPRFKYVNLKASLSILKFGGVFFWNQIMYTALTGTNAFFISSFLRPGLVVEYQVYFRVFSLIGILFNLALTPMWSAITKAFEEEDKAWILKYFRYLTKASIFVFIVHLLIIPILQLFVDLWLGRGTIQVSFNYAVIFAIFGSVFVLQNILSTFACGIGTLRLQAYFYTFGVIVKVILTYYLTRIYPSWIIIVLVDILVIFPYCIFQAIDLRKRFQ